MTSVAEVLCAVEQIAPTRFAFSSDKVGLHVGDPNAEVKSAIVSLDHSAGAVHACQTKGASLLLTHHPLIWEPLRTLTDASHVERVVANLLRSDIAHIAAHTNWDCAKDGVNDTLAERLGLVDVTPFGTAATVEWRKIVVFAPESAVEKLIDAMADAGAGIIGDYRRCAFQSSGTGSFVALADAKPRVGLPNARNDVLEVRIEMELLANSVTRVVAAMRGAHPYEEPAFDLLVVAPKPAMPIGRKGRLSTPLMPGEFQRHIDRALGTRSLAWVGSDQPIEWVGAVGGAADDEWRKALDDGCQAFVTGEVKQHVALEASEFGVTMFSAGHYATEHPGLVTLASRMRERLPDVAWHVYEPEPGRDGRPL
jgi:dinuclear metal center YbgI/SA1388 family protein